MAAPSVTNTFVANTTASASEVNANFTDIVNGLSSGSTWDVVVSTLNAGTTSLDGAVTINDSGADVDFRVEGDTNQNLLFCDASADKVGICTSSPSAGLDVSDGSIGLIVGADNLATTRTTTTEKNLRFGCPHYDNTELPLGAIVAASASTSSIVYIGGGSGLVNSATEIRFMTGTSTTTPAGTTRMNIDSNGNVGINCTSSSTDRCLSMHCIDDSSWPFFIANSAGTNSLMYLSVTGATSAQIFCRSTTIGSISDGRLKENITALSGSLDKIKALKPCTWDWKAGHESMETKGFIAQEIQPIFPEAVSEGENGYLNVGASGTGMIAELVAAIQEQQAIIEALTARIEALEAK
jgi:hypothetical protein